MLVRLARVRSGSRGQRRSSQDLARRKRRTKWDAHAIGQRTRVLETRRQLSRRTCVRPRLRIHRSVELEQSAPISRLLPFRLTCLVEKERTQNQMIDMRPHEADIGVVRRADDWFATNIEAGIHDD